jgi:peroxiredoxin
MWRSGVMWVALAVSAMLVAVLAWQNRGLRQDRSELVDRIRHPYPGMYVPVVDAKSLTGESIALGRPEVGRQVLFFFNHTCPYCLASAPTIADAGRELRSEFRGRAQMLGVCDCSEAQAGEYATRHSFDFPVVTMRDSRYLALYRARTVPVLMVVDREGRVRHALQGVFDKPQQVRKLMAVLRDDDARPAK